MSVLNDAEQAAAAADVRELILSSGKDAMLLREQPGENLYGSDDEAFAEVGSFRLEFARTPPEDTANKIDATASALPELDIRAEDRVRTDTETYRVQTVVEESLFGIVTHKSLKLVRLYGS